MIPVTHQGDCRVHSIDEPFRTITAARRGEFSLIVPSLIHSGNGERKGQSPRILDSASLADPAPTVTGGGGRGGAKLNLVRALLIKHALPPVEGKGPVLVDIEGET